MDNVGSFVNINKHNLYFSGCHTCEGQCCNGANGFALSPLILEDFEAVYKHFTIVFGWQNKKINAYMILNNGEDYCKYYVNNQCSNYENRAPACKLYPVSPYFEHILVDTECPSINTEFGTQVHIEKDMPNSFYHQRLENFAQKREETLAYLESINNINDFKFHTSIGGLPLLKYNKPSDDPYIKMHLESLVHYEKKPLGI